MMNGLGEDVGDVGSIIAAQVGHDDAGAVAFGPQGEQEGQGGGLVVGGIDGDVQQIVGIDIHSQVDVHPAPHLAGRFIIFGDQDILFIHPNHATGLIRRPPATGHSPRR